MFVYRWQLSNWTENEAYMQSMQAILPEEDINQLIITNEPNMTSLDTRRSLALLSFQHVQHVNVNAGDEDVHSSSEVKQRWIAIFRTLLGFGCKAGQYI